MRIEGYGLSSNSLAPATARLPIHARPTTETATTTSRDTELTPQERLRQILEQKRWMAEAAFADSIPEAELGKHIDLRV
jgi:hypothetical protein